MGTARLFIPQERLDSWAAEDVIEIDEHRLSIGGTDDELEIAPAVRFMQEVGGEGDSHGLIGKVKTTAQLEEMGADHMHDSVLVEESAYEVLEGYSASRLDAAASQQPSESVKETVDEPPEARSEEGSSEAEDLARLLIEKLD
ncbi:MAG: hypothetical protein JRG91_00010 [Deltaproteobacteria bacterium]|nr:hypothetical protein [Deltaproteobacteria bacterium]